MVEPEMVNPAGRGEAVQLVAVFDVVIEYETAIPFVPVADNDEVMTGGFVTPEVNSIAPRVQLDRVLPNISTSYGLDSETPAVVLAVSEKSLEAYAVNGSPLPELVPLASLCAPPELMKWL